MCYEWIILIICDTNLNYCSALFLHNRKTSRVQIRDDILRDGLVCFIPCSRSGPSFSQGRRPRSLSLSFLTEKVTPWPLPLKLEFDPYPWYLITPASYLSTSWNSDRDSKNHTISFSDSTTPRFFGCGKIGQALLYFICYSSYSTMTISNLFEELCISLWINCNPSSINLILHQKRIKAFLKDSCSVLHIKFSC